MKKIYKRVSPTDDWGLSVSMTNSDDLKKAKGYRIQHLDQVLRLDVGETCVVHEVDENDEYFGEVFFLCTDVIKA